MATPANDGGVSKAVAGAKKALENAANSNVAARGGAAASKKEGPAAKKVASGIMDGLGKMASDRMKGADGGAGVGAELKAKSDNVKEYTDALPKMHDGGKVKKDGAHNLKKGEVVVTEKDAKKMGIAEGLKDKKDSKGKDEKKESKSKKASKHSKTEIEHHDDGSHTVRHFPKKKPMSADGAMEPMEEPTSYAAPDMAALHAGMDQHLGEAPDPAEMAGGAGPAAGGAQ